MNKRREQYLKDLRMENDRIQQDQTILTESTSREEKKEILKKIQFIREDGGIEKAMQLILDKNEDPEQRLLALRKLEIPISKRQDLIDELISILNNKSDNLEVRKAALEILQQSSLRTAMFNPKKPDYLKALRGLIKEKHQELRIMAMEILAGEKDEFLQRALTEGLQNPAKALVAPEKAIQLLGYDIHANLYPLLRDIIKNPPNNESKMEATRLLGGDPGSKELLSQLMNSKKEEKEIRITAAVGMQTLDPESFNKVARTKVMDEEEEEDLRAVCLNALTQNIPVAKLKQDKELVEFVTRKASKHGSERKAFTVSSADAQMADDELDKASSIFLSNLQKAKDPE